MSPPLHDRPRTFLARRRGVDKDAVTLAFLRWASGHSLQLPKRIKRSERDEFEAHQVGLAERQLLDHVVSGSRVGHVQDESDACPFRKAYPDILVIHWGSI